MLLSRKYIEELEARQLLSADLVGSFTGKVPAAVSLKSPTKLSVHILNSGDAAAATSATLYLFASTDSTLDSSDPVLLKSSVKLNLKPGKSATLTESFSAPLAVSSGSYSLIGYIVPKGLVEASSANNVFIAASKTTITPPIVDLTGAVSVSPKTTSFTVGGKAQKPIALTISVTNRGNVPAKGPMSINLYGSTNTVFDFLDPLLAKIPTKKVTINPNKSMKFTLNFKPTVATPSGKFYAIADVNAGTTIQTAIAESNINNDTALTSTTFTVNNASIPFKAKFVGSLADNINAVIIGNPEAVTFSAAVANVSASTEVEVDEVDSSGNLIGKITDLHDAGSIGDGDGIAGDGIFSGIVAVGFSAPGTRYFVAKLTDSSTTSQTTATSIPGINPPTSQELAQDDTDASTATAGAVAIAAAHGTAAQIVASVQAGLRSDPNVKPGSIVTTDSGIAWESSDGIIEIVNTDELLGNRGASVPIQTFAGVAPNVALGVASQSANSFSVSALHPADSSADGQAAIVLDPFASEFGKFDDPSLVGDEGPAIAQMLSDGGYDTTFLANNPGGDQITNLGVYQGLGSNAAVVISSHGGVYGDRGAFLSSGVDDFQDPQVNHASDLINGRLAMGGTTENESSPGHVAHEYALCNTFFTRYTGSMDGSIVYLGACHLGDTTDMPNAFLDLGAAAVIAFTGSVQSPWAAPRGIAAFKTLLQPTDNTIGDIPGINSDQDIGDNITTDILNPPATSQHVIRPDGLVITQTNHNYFVRSAFLSFGDLKATLPGRPKLLNVNLIVTYSWPNNEKDLDSLTKFAGDSAGFGYTGATYMNWLGDQQGAGLQETTIVDLYDAWKAGIFAKTTTVGVGADWYTPDEGKGPATISIALEDINTEKQYQIQTLVINPATETDGATSQQGVITVTLGGDPSDPTITVKLTHS